MDPCPFPLFSKGLKMKRYTWKMKNRSSPKWQTNHTESCIKGVVAVGMIGKQTQENKKRKDNQIPNPMSTFSQQSNRDPTFLSTQTLCEIDTNFVWDEHTCNSGIIPPLQQVPYRRSNRYQHSSVHPDAMNRPRYNSDQKGNLSKPPNLQNKHQETPIITISHTLNHQQEKEKGIPLQSESAWNHCLRWMSSCRVFIISIENVVCLLGKKTKKPMKKRSEIWETDPTA